MKNRRPITRHGDRRAKAWARAHGRPYQPLVRMFQLRLCFSALNKVRRLGLPYALRTLPRTPIFESSELDRFELRVGYYGFVGMPGSIVINNLTA